MPVIHEQLPLEIPITITSGDDVLLPFQLNWILPDGTKDTVDLSYYAVRSRLLSHCGDETSLQVDIIDVSTATILVHLPSSLTSVMQNGWSYIYVLDLVGQNGEERQIGRGRIQVKYHTNKSCC